MHMELPAEENELEYDNDCDALPISNLDSVKIDFDIFKTLCTHDGQCDKDQ